MIPSYQKWLNLTIEKYKIQIYYVVDIWSGASGEHLKSVSKNYSSADKTVSVFEDALIAKRKYQRHNKLHLGKNLKGFKGI